MMFLFLDYADGAGKLRYPAGSILDSVKFYGGYLWNFRRGAWRSKLEMGAYDYHRLEYYCEGPKLHRKQLFSYL